MSTPMRSISYRLKTIRLLLRALGLPGTVRVMAFKLAGAETVRVNVKGAPFPVVARMNNSDLPLLAEILCSDECVVDLSWQPRTVLDLGANIGLTAVKLHQQFPLAKLIAVEPDRNTVAVCRLNVSHMSNATVLHAAIGYGAGTVRCVNPNEPSISRRFEDCDEDDAQSVKALSIRRILDEHDCEPPILIKMDIEGSESACFANSISWLPLVRGVLVEPHDPISETVIRQRLSAEGFSTTQVGEKILGERQ